MNVLILGAGGVGGYLGCRLMQSGVPVVFLARGQTVRRLNENGLRLTSPFGDWEGEVQAITAADRPRMAFDLVVLACKTYDLAQAIDDIRPFVGARTKVLPLLNGVTHMERLVAAFPSAVLGGLAHIMVSVSADGAIVHGNDLHRYRFGALPGGDDRVPRDLVDALGQVPIEAGVSAHILDEMWSKFQFISGFAAVTSLLKGSAGMIAATEDGADIMREALAETARIAEAEGFPVSAEHMGSVTALSTERGSGFTSSLLRDVAAGRRAEGDALVGDMLRRARRHSISAPVLRMAWACLQVYERDRARR